MKIVYIAGKLTGANNWEIAQNVRRAETVAFEVAKLGAMPLIPHANTGMNFFGTLDEAFWYAGTLELLRRCDAIVLVPGWQLSKGALAERDEAYRRGVYVFDFEKVDEFQTLALWLKERE